MARSCRYIWNGCAEVAARHSLRYDSLYHVSGDDVLARLMHHVLVVFARHVEFGRGVGLAVQVRFGDFDGLTETGYHVVYAGYGVFVRTCGITLNVGVADYADAVLEVVEHQVGCGQHEHGFRQIEGICARDGQPLEMSHGVIGYVADRAAVELAEVVNVGDLEFGQHLLDGAERVYRAQRLGGAGLDDLDRVSPYHAVPRYLLSARYTLQQVGVRAARHLEIGGYGRLQVCADLAVHGHQVGVAGVLFYFFQWRVVHWSFLVVSGFPPSRE